ncbi:MAG: hypothetical protein EOM10_12675 [Opitutae bacterium]|nr:hypothetical protein [Opitutae bacterium]
MVTLLKADATLMALLTGGVYDASLVEVISRDRTAGAFDANKELLPCALVQATNRQVVPTFRRADQLGLTVYCYQRFGSATIEAASLRIRTLLDRVRVAGLGSSQTWECQFAEMILGQRDLALRAALVVSRYRVPVA